MHTNIQFAFNLYTIVLMCILFSKGATHVHAHDILFRLADSRWLDKKPTNIHNSVSSL